MKRKISLVAMLTFGILLCVISSPLMADDPIRVMVDGTELAFDIPPQLINGRIMVPMRTIFEALSARVEWHESGQFIFAFHGDKAISMQIDNLELMTRDKIITLDVPPQLIDGRTLVPVRAVAEGLDAVVEWDSEMRTVMITKEGSVADKPTVPDLSKVFSLMDDRLFVAMPEGADYFEPQVHIMGAPASHQEEMWLIFETGIGKFALYAYEFFHYSSGNIEDDAKRVADRWLDETGVSFQCSRLNNDKIQAMQLTPTVFVPAGDSVLLGSAIVKTADQMLVAVNLYADSKLFTHQEYCFTLADSVLGSLYAGTRMIETDLHKESIWLHEIEIQKGYVLMLNRGPDFDVYYINKIVELNNKQPNMGIYIGAHPSGVRAPTNVKVTTITDQILGNKIEWMQYEQNGIKRAETVFSIPVNDSLMMHIFISAIDEKSMEEMKTMARSLVSKE